MDILLITILVCSFWFGHASSNETACSDWEPYKNEHCYKIIDIAKLEPYQAAESICQKNAAHLVTIRYAEEQTFLTNFVFKKNKVVDNVWIGAKYSENKYKWKDGSELMFTNWASGYPKNHADYCVQMHSDDDSVGKWVDESCLKKNVVVCQKQRPWSQDLIEEAVFEMKYTLQQMQVKLSQVEQKLQTSEKNLAETKQNLATTNMNLAETKQNFTNSLSQVSIVPIGFIYVQLPKEKAPKDIWPSVTWTEVSSSYAGVFFRVAGEGAATFGQTQEANSTVISHVAFTNARTAGDSAFREIKAGQWSGTIYTGRSSGDPDYIKFYMTSGENRPRNMAIRVWKRTG